MNTTATITPEATVTAQVFAVAHPTASATDKVHTSAQISSQQVVSATAARKDTVTGTVGYARPGSDRPIYHGATTVTPDKDAIALGTAGKVVLQDITVLAVPSSRVVNPYGTTFNIGG